MRPHDARAGILGEGGVSGGMQSWLTIRERPVISCFETIRMIALSSAMLGPDGDIAIEPVAIEAAPASASAPVPEPQIHESEMPPDMGPGSAIHAKNERLIRRGRVVALSSIAPLVLVPIGAALFIAGLDFDVYGTLGDSTPPPEPPGPDQAAVGLGLAATGLVASLALLTTGVTMIGVGKRRETKHLRAGVPTPTFSPRGVGLGWAIRF
jgi:hypothetical protein